MHARDLVQLAVLVGEHGPVLVDSKAQIQPADLESYWTHSRARLNRWGHDLKELSTRAEVAPRIEQSHIRQLMEEIFASEVLTRIWTAVLFAYDRRHEDGEALPVAHGIFLGHVETRNRCLKLLVARSGLARYQAVELNRTRRATERWCDLLLAPLTAVDDVARFGHDPERVTRLAKHLRGDAQDGSRRAMAVAFAHAASVYLRDTSPNADLNAGVGAAILGCFSADVFDSTGLLQSWFVARLHRAAADTQGLIDDLFACDEPEETAPDGFLRGGAGQGSALRDRFRSS